MESGKNKLPLVVIFGRTNVGKSTLFNRLSEKRTALVSDIPGTTRDSNIGEVNWGGVKFRLVDTGGVDDIEPAARKPAGARGRQEKEEKNDIETKVKRQVRKYVTDADIVIFVVDAAAGIMPQDSQLVRWIKKNLPATGHIILAANKADNMKLRRETAEFNKLAIGEPLPVSAASGSGTGDLLDEIIKKTGKRPCRLAEAENKNNGRGTKPVNIAIIGKPNVGKSSLVNALLGEDRVIVSPIPHTTREPQDTEICYGENVINLIDTAGISRSGQRDVKRVKDRDALERQSIMKSLAAVKRADVVLLMLDINAEITHQDAKLVEVIIEAGKGLAIIANKWDQVRERNTKFYTEYIRDCLPFVTWVPIQFASARTGEKVGKILALALEIAAQRKMTVSDNALGRFLAGIVKRHRPAGVKAKSHPRVYGMTQTKTAPPRFLVKVGSGEELHFSYLRFIENRLREKFGFSGTPIFIETGKK